MTREIRVLEVLGRSAGGIGRHVGQLVEHLDGSRGLAIEVAAPADLRVPLPKPPLTVDIPDGPFGHRSAVNLLRSLLDAKRYDVVHAHGLRAGIDVGRAARTIPTSVLLTVHNVIHPQISGRLKAAVFGAAEPVAIRLSDHVFAPSREIATHLLGKATAATDKIEVLYLGVGDELSVTRTARDVRDELAVDVAAPLVVTVARLAPQKALNVMLQAFALLRADAHLAIVGEGPLEGDLKKHARQLGVEGRVHFLGYRDRPADYVAAADVFCLSSTWEAVALAAQEAALVGTPVVTTDAGGMRELFEDGVSGRVVATGDVAALARALDDTLRSPEQARAFAQQAKETLRKRFSTERMLARLEAAYRGFARAR